MEHQVYTEDSLCPECGSALAVKLMQKGIRLKCTKCRFFVYPRPEQMSESLTAGLFAHVGHHVACARSRLDKYISSLKDGDNQVQEE